MNKQDVFLWGLIIECDIELAKAYSHDWRESLSDIRTLRDRNIQDEIYLWCLSEDRNRAERTNQGAKG